MVRLKAEIQYVIFALIFLVAAFLGVKQAGFLNDKNITIVDHKEVEKKFTESIYTRKVRLNFQTEDITKVSAEIRLLLKNENVNEIYSRKMKNDFVGLYEISTDNNDIVGTLRSNIYLISESLETNNNLDQVINIKSNLENYQASKEGIANQLNSKAISTNTKRELRKDLAIIQGKLDSLEYLPTLIKKSKNSELVFIGVIPSSAAGILNLASIKTFFKVFFLILFTEILGLILLYLVMFLMTKLLKALGVKTSRGKSSNYNNNSYYGRNKKVKRVYKDHKESDKK